MHLGYPLWLAVLLLNSQTSAFPYPDDWAGLHHERFNLERRQQVSGWNTSTQVQSTTPQVLSSSIVSEISTSISLVRTTVQNITTPAIARPPSTKPSTPISTPITQPPQTTPEQSTNVLTTSTNATTTTATATTLTVSNGETATPDVGSFILGGSAGGFLLVNGVTFSVPQGALVSVLGAGGNGQAPEVTTLRDPEQTQDPGTTADPGPTSEEPTTLDSTPTSVTATSSSTPSSTASPSQYIVLVSSDATEAQIQEISKILAEAANPDTLTEVTSERTGLVVFWKATISPDQAETLRKTTGVSSVSEDVILENLTTTPVSTPSATPRSTAATGVPGSPSTDVPNPPRGASLNDLPGYGYASEAGKGVTIYVIDTGANPENPEWSGMPGTKEFIFPPSVPAIESDFLNHGSCVASKATGPKFGTAKNANIVMLKLPADLHMSAIFASLVEVSNDVYQKGLAGKAVINMSLGSRIGDKVADTREAYKLLLASIIMEDIVIVTASGNDAQYGIYDVSDYPALFVKDMDIVVVGAVDKDGYREFYSQGSGDQLTVSAPGNVDCASGRNDGDTELYGTSFAAPAVAGVIAVWLSQEQYKTQLQVPGKVVANVKSLLQSLAYERVEGEPPVVWNGVDPRGLACAVPAANGKRQEATTPSACQATSTSVLSSSSSILETIAISTLTSATLNGTTLVSTPPTSTTLAISTTAQPTVPAKPEWTTPAGWEIVFEADGVASHSYSSTANSASDGLDGNPEQWCLDKCGDGCSSVFLSRQLQLIRGQYNIYFICNMYDRVWSDEFRQDGFEGQVDAGVALNKL
ncbi:peptidase S8/S53 domain-containing protein [Thelonectria olida]|uniref:Peptidase S8/S53 domain-containing protein n=1 Tax=Thelonectria olida TaxID=1576542 RepID=A0A9P8W3C0_9HYPO|nr:peptidase S8/S53 domain-containing protein [Thelonectria olida]